MFKMADSHKYPSSANYRLFFIVGLLLTISLVNNSYYKGSNYNLNGTEQEIQVYSADLVSVVFTVPMTGVRRHFGAKYLHCNGYFATRICRYPNSTSTFQMSRFKTSGDICPNPGPATATALKCPVCTRIIARNHRALNCESCQLKYHIKCGKVSPREYTALQTSNPLYFTDSVRNI